MVEVIAGGLGGIAVVLVGHPFDTTKTRLQVAPRGYYKSTLDCVRHTIRDEGFLGFYSGMSSPLLGQMVFRALSFTTFHETLSYLRKSNPSTSSSTLPLYSALASPTASLSTTGKLFAAGGLTGLVISFVETPIDVVKTKLQIQIFASKFELGGAGTAARVPVPAQPPFNSFSTCVAHIVRTHGPRALYQGLSATILRNIPANALFFPVNELAKQQLVARKSRLQPLQRFSANDLGLAERLCAGACAGMCYWVLTYPLDAIKGRMQGTPFEQRATWMSTARGILRDHGLKGLTRGLVPCAARSVPACAALFTTMDLVKLSLS